MKAPEYSYSTILQALKLIEFRQSARPVRINRATIAQFAPDFIDFVRFQNNQGYYVWAFVDEYYIPGTGSYQNSSNPHSILLYGYDDAAEIVHAAGYFHNQTYGTVEIPYSVIHVLLLQQRGNDAQL